MSEHSVISMTPTGETRAQRRARVSAEREAMTKAAGPTGRKDTVVQEFPIRSGGRWGKLTQMWGPAAPRLPHHQTTSLRFGVATPFLAESGIGYQGAVVGVDNEGGGLFAFDPWELYRLGLVTGTSMVCIGMVGSGKSTTNKAMATRLIALGRRVAVGSDPKAEWVRVARAVTGVVIDIKPGGDTCVNPLDSGVRPKGMDDQQWARMVASRRSQVMQAILSLLSHGKPFDAYAQTALREALKRVSNDRAITVPIISDVMHALLNPTNEVRTLSGKAGIELGLLLRNLVEGDELAGMFDGESTIDINTLGDAPMIVFDTSALFGGSETAMSIATVCTNAWLDSVVMARSGNFWVLVNEEGWSSMRAAKNVELLDARQRMAGEWGLANMLIMHELEDLDMVGQEGSEQRNQALGLLRKAQIKIIHKQGYESAKGLSSVMGLTRQERVVVQDLNQGEALWKIGKKSFRVQTKLTLAELELFHTDEGRAG